MPVGLHIQVAKYLQTFVHDYTYLKRGIVLYAHAHMGAAAKKKKEKRKEQVSN